MGLRVLVAGAGAVGSVLGGLLVVAGTLVPLLGRVPPLAAVAAEGLALEGLWGERRVRDLRLAARLADLGPSYDAVLLTVKAFDTEAMLAATSGRLAADGCLIVLQNG